MKSIYTDIARNPWINLYQQWRCTNAIRPFILFGATSIFILYATSLIDSHEAMCAALGIGMSMISFAFVFGFVHIMTGRAISKMASRYGMETSSVKKYIADIYKEK